MSESSLRKAETRGVGGLWVQAGRRRKPVVDFEQA